jgi:hypothetical protein
MQPRAVIIAAGLAKVPHPVTSLLALKEALPALRRLAAAPATPPPALRAIVAAAESDLRMLDDAHLARQPGDLVKQIAGERPGLAAAVAQVKARLGGTGAK